MEHVFLIPYCTSSSICTQQAKPSRATRSIVSRDRPYQCPPYCIVWTNWPWQCENKTEKDTVNGTWCHKAQINFLNERHHGCSAQIHCRMTWTLDLWVAREHCSFRTDKPLTPVFNCTWVHLAAATPKSLPVKLLLTQSNSQTHVFTSLVKGVLKHQ